MGRKETLRMRCPTCNKLIPIVGFPIVDCTKKQLKKIKNCPTCGSYLEK